MDGYDLDRRGMVLRLERSSIYDGDGFRTVVFLKGCPLRCQWCSTPESQSFAPERAGERVYGREMTAEEVLREVRKDAPFYFHSGGGMTLSGGELLAQPEFSLALLKNARRECVNTAIETSFYGPWESIAAILPHVNTAYVDLKLFSGQLHKEYCGVDNGGILDNLLATNGAEGRFKLVVRIPIIPGVNDFDGELEKMGRFCKKLERLDHVQLLPYHRLGTATYEKLGRPYPLEWVEPPGEAQMARCRDIFGRHVARVI